jgi:hypothetical protein
MSRTFLFFQPFFLSHFYIKPKKASELSQMLFTVR